MRKIVYYVATSIDGYIAGVGGDASEFRAAGAGVAQYLRDLQDFDTVIMGRRTYEFGYQYGLKPGQPAYPHMIHHIFSNTLSLENPDSKVSVEPLSLGRIKEIKAAEGSSIYLCGGGIFAGWLLNNQLIDQVKIKLNPLILGNGIPLFVGVKQSYHLNRIMQNHYEDIQIIDYEVLYE